MHSVVIYTLVSVFIISLISLIGILTFRIKTKRLQTILIYFISFSAGALFGDAFLHLLPEIAKETNFALTSSLFILLGILIMFFLEKIIHWHHCHEETTEEHKHPVTYLTIIGDALHNFIDGIIIAASYLVSFSVGTATTLAVALHEIPHELGNFSILVHGGFSRKRALLLNFLSAITSFIGAILVLWLGNVVQNIQTILVPIAAGTFIYIAGSDLVPEIHKHSEKLSNSILQLAAFVAGILIIALFLLLE